MATLATAARTALVALLLIPGLACTRNAVRSGAAGGGTAQLQQVWEVGGLHRPESAVYDPQQKAVYVSSINGDGTAKDGNGYITKLAPDGKVVAHHWVSGLNGPKGMALRNGKLYVSDIDELVEVDVNTGRVAARYPAAGSSFLNDVAADASGNVYVSDSRTNLIYRLSGGQITPWLQNADVKSPNGVYAGPSGVIIAAADASAENAGGARYLMSVSADGKQITPLRDKTPMGALDAIEPDGHGGYFLSDWASGQVSHYTPEKGATTLIQLGQGTADLDYVAETGMLFLPVMMSDRIVAYRVNWSK